MSILPTIEYQRLQAATYRHSDWKRWGPYLSERARCARV